MLVSLENAGIFRSKKWLVRGVSMTVEAGEIVTLIGPNGSGKSTTAKLALGVLSADEGHINRKDGLCVSYVPQKLKLSPHLPLTVTRFLRLTSRPDRKAINLALNATGTDHLADEQMGSLSGGEFQRVLLARAIFSSPELLVLDEPVQGVDFKGEQALYKLIEDIRNQLNCGILLISHDLHVVMSTTDRVICLNGHVCCSGTPATVSSSNEFKSLFGHRASSGLAIYEHKHDHEHRLDGSVAGDSTNANNAHTPSKSAVLLQNARAPISSGPINHKAITHDKVNSDV
ncbi:ATP-binding cassette domain-containing protein [Alphaproteobacteria bacterium]|nr:ATP-binding cassette domain-containing protein [Alphaproteobacteria bacterium]